MTEKKITVKGSYPYEFTVYDDNSLTAKCVRCDITDSRPPEIGVKLIQSAEWYKTFTCNKCWRGEREAKREEEYNERRDDIARGQSWNLAVGVVASYVGKLRDADDVKDQIKEWREWFYKELQEGRGRE